MPHAVPAPAPRPLRRSAAVIGAAAIATLGLGALPAGAAVEGGNVVIDLIGINDFHGRISTQDSNGAVALASAVQDARAENADTVFISAGDNFGASTFVSMINDDVPTLQILNELDLAVSALGNHEFDQSLDTLWQRIDGRPAVDGEPAWPALDFPYLGANVEAPGDRQFEEYHIHEVVNPAGDPIKIGFVGILTQDMPSLVSPAGIAGMAFTDMADAAIRVADQLTDEDETNGEADVVVVLVHEGSSTAAGVTDQGTNFGGFVAELAANGNVDAVFSGHTHVQYEVGVERDDLPAMPVVQTGAFSDALGEITLTVDGQTRDVVDVDTNMIDLEEYPTRPNDDVVAAVAQIVQDAEATAEVRGAVPVGEVDRPLQRAVQSDGSENRGGESAIGNLIADAQLWALGQQFPDNPADVAFMNPGGIRADIVGNDDGVVTYRQVATAQPFGNTLVTLDLTGEQIAQVLEEQWQPEGASRPFLKLGVSANLFYLYDPQAERGSRITDVSLDGEPLDPDERYRVVTNSFLAAGGDNFAAFAAGANVADSGLVDLAAFVDYFDATGEVVAPLEQRAVGAHWLTAPQASYAPGDEIAVDLSSLSFSAEDAQPEQLVLSLTSGQTGETVELGTVPVDNTVVDATDEGGQAAVRVSVPELAGLGTEPQAWQLTVDAGVSGSFSVGVQLVAAEQARPTPTGEPTAAPVPTQAAPGGTLPATGAETTGLLAAATAFMILGGLLVSGAAMLRRRALTSA